MNSKYKTIKYKQSKPSNIEDLVSIEEPLEMVVRYKKENQWIDNSISITMRTPKNDEDLIVGLLFCEGIIQKDQPIRVLRDSVVIYEGELESLRRFKEDVKEVKSGTECGIGVKDYNDVKAGDQIEVFKRTEIKRTIQ